MAFIPLGERVLVKRTEIDNKTASGIFIPDNAKEKPSTAKVVAIAKDINDIKVDDIVVFGKYSGSELSHEGEDFLILDLKEILGVIR